MAREGQVQRSVDAVHGRLFGSADASAVVIEKHYELGGGGEVGHTRSDTLIR